MNLEDKPENQNPNDVATLHRPTLLSKLLSHSMPNLQPPAIQPKTSARVLTSTENLRILEEKKRKDEKEALKEQRKREREAKWLIKDALSFLIEREVEVFILVQPDASCIVLCEMLRSYSVYTI